MTTGSIRAVLVLSSLGFAVSCRQEPPQARATPALDSNTIACVEGQVLSCEAFRGRLKAAAGLTGDAPSLATRQAVLEEMLRHESVFARARAEKFEEQPEIAAQIRDLIVSRYIARQLPDSDLPVSSEAIQAHYRDHGAEFVAPAKARGAIVLLRASAKLSSDRRAERKQHAHRILAEARQAPSDADFARLVQRHSEHQATRYQGGDLGWMTREECEATWGAGMAAALFALPTPGDFAPVLETPEGFHLLKLRERKEAHLRPLQEVEDLIRHRLSRQHRFQREAEFFARMKQGLDIQINQPLFESITVPAAVESPPGLPGSTPPRRVAIR